MVYHSLRYFRYPTYLGYFEYLGYLKLVSDYLEY